MPVRVFIWWKRGSVCCEDLAVAVLRQLVLSAVVAGLQVSAAQRCACRVVPASASAFQPNLGIAVRSRAAVKVLYTWILMGIGDGCVQVAGLAPGKSGGGGGPLRVYSWEVEHGEPPSPPR